jgi:hypothetical protein
VELLIAAFIMAIGILGLMSLMTFSVGQSTRSRGRVTATYVAEWVLQRAQMEGQQVYFAKNVKMAGGNIPPLFTANPGLGVPLTNYGGFNVDGVQVTNSMGAVLPGIATQIPDPMRRIPIFQASWSRRAYLGDSPVTAAQCQEFIVNITWTEENQPRALSVSRMIRY